MTRVTAMLAGCLLAVSTVAMAQETAYTCAVRVRTPIQTPWRPSKSVQHVRNAAALKLARSGDRHQPDVGRNGQKAATTRS
jgi:hypothetical protein